MYQVFTVAHFSLCYLPPGLLVFCGEALLNVKAQYKVKARGGVLLAKCKMLFLAHRDVIFVSSV